MIIRRDTTGRPKKKVVYTTCSWRDIHDCHGNNPHELGYNVHQDGPMAEPLDAWIFVVLAISRLSCVRVEILNADHWLICALFVTMAAPKNGNRTKTHPKKWKENHVHLGTTVLTILETSGRNIYFFCVPQHYKPRLLPARVQGSVVLKGKGCRVTNLGIGVSQAS